MAKKTIQLWETNEIVLNAANSYENPYTEVMVWADLKGPGFDKRVFGFWDGDNTFRIRVTATAPGLWTYVTGSNVDLSLIHISECILSGQGFLFFTVLHALHDLI